MEVQQMTVDEAIAAGYSMCLKDGSECVEDICDVDPEDLAKSEYWISEKESHSLAVTPEQIQELIVDHICNQTEVHDEDGELADLVAAMPIAAFESLSKAVCDTLSSKQFWPTTDILLVPNP